LPQAKLRSNTALPYCALTAIFPTGIFHSQFPKWVCSRQFAGNVLPGYLLRGPGDSLRGQRNLLSGPGDVVQKPGDISRGPGDFLQRPGNVSQKPEDLLFRHGYVL
jgi:hypothetical protein